MKFGPKPIQDEFTDLPISRQRKYQLRKKAQGLCTICGQKKAANGSLCLDCLKKRGVKEPGRGRGRHKRQAS